MREIIKRRTDLSRDENVVYLSAISVFCPFYITGLVILILNFYIFFKTDIRKTVFPHFGSILIPIFSLFTTITALCHKNYFGAGASVVFFLIMALGFYIRTVMTRDTFEKALDLCCISAVISSMFLVAEKLMFLGRGSHRCFGNFFSQSESDWFITFYMHPNYIATTLATVILICAYKVIIKKSNKKFYYLFAAISAIGMFLTESIFSWIEVFIGLSVLLILAKRHKLLSALFILAATACFVLYISPDIFPRITHISGTTNNRVLIWNLSVESIPDSLWCGRGFFAYFDISNKSNALIPQSAYTTTHAHNIFLEPLLSFGIIGSILLFIGIFILFHRIILCKSFLRKSGITSLLLAITAGILVHSIIDMTMLWLQTALLYCVVFGGIGADEKRLFAIFKNYRRSAKNNHKNSTEV